MVRRVLTSATPPRSDAHLTYGNWIRRRILVFLGAAALIAGLMVLLPFGPLYQIVMLIVFAILLATFAFPAYAYWMFSARGGHFQEKLWTVVADALGPVPHGAILDIGAGSGILAVMLAQRNREIRVLGVDYWGHDWEYSRAICEANAAAAGVDGQVEFRQGDAAALAFDDGTFDAVVSNLTFHEVKAVDDKRRVIVEALRVLRPAGRFSFVDYFYEPAHYGAASELTTFLRELGLAEFSLRPLRDELAIPLLLRHPRAFGRVGILIGAK